MSHPDDTIDTELARAAAAGSELGKLVLRMWKTTRINWSFATDTLADAFRNQRNLGGRERRFAAETLYGMIRHLRRIDQALASGGVSAHNAAPDRERMLAYLLLEGGLPRDDAAAAAPRVDWSAVAGVDERLARETRPARRVALMHSLPDWLAARIVADFGDEAEAFAAALNQRAPMTVRANTLARDRDALAAALAEEGIDTTPGALCDTALHVDTRTNLFSLRPFKAGWFEAQDEGSQLIADLVAPPPRGLVVDACAGAGGKTLALAAALANRGRVVASDVDKRKLAELRRRAKRAGATNVQVVELSHDGGLPAPLARIEGKAARVLIDAPCSGIGALRRNPEARWRLTEGDLDRMPALQRDIAERMAPLVAAGGRLIYATCTVLRAENEDVVDAIVDAVPDLEVMPAKAVWGKERASRICDESGTFLKVTPHRHGTDGFFAAVLRSRRSTESPYA